MDKIIKISKLQNPNFVKPMLLDYTHKGKQKKWEAVISHDSVSILLWHKEKDSFVIVKQLRPAVLNVHPSDGYMHELCAGIIDKNTSNIQIAKEEVFEECGYDVPLEKLQHITSFYTNVGISGSHQELYYAELCEYMKVTDGGGLLEEDIEVIYIKCEDAKKFMFDTSLQKTPGMMMAFYWFFDNIKAQ
ncbi:NUDIX hydrolase [Sulfurimonas sp.]|jgi:UDP-sugar diphosphatase|uniref:NUDIX hydrolase n=1 Tax=Sulfurimonas sp. TaxID=2022749 RepID=UPI0025F6DB9E|nr:NUDIX hydrolase [Sulfurimonas sp.]MBT5934753.1 NUDIX hydrolase [Sulfurimonas sp.]